MWVLLIKVDNMVDYHRVKGLGMPFAGFHIMEQAISFMAKNLDKYVNDYINPDGEVKEILIKFEETGS